MTDSKDAVEKVEKPLTKEELLRIPSSPTGGVKAFPIEGPFGDERYRLSVGMTDEDRAYRKQWLKDQILAETEPRMLPGWYRASFNPIRRFYRKPLDQLVYEPLKDRIGQNNAAFYRYMTGKAFLFLAVAYGAGYFFMFHTHNWTRMSGWRVYETRAPVLPGDPGYGVPLKIDKSEYYAHGFKDSPI